MGEIEIGEHDVTRFVDKDIFGLQVSIDDTEQMQIFECDEDFRCVKPGVCFRKSMLLLAP